MKLIAAWMGFWALCVAASPALGAVPVTCVGKFPNFVTDLCWSCIMPITIGSMEMGNLDGQEDIENPGNTICSCGMKPKIGVTVGYWEPVRLAEAVRKPYCLVSMGGMDLGAGIAAPEGARFTRPEGDGDGGSFYQAHFYTAPVIHILKVVADFPCAEEGTYDLAYITEVDPLWADDELTLIINPEAALFANPVAIASCAADCVAATLGWGIPELFWCAGCQGGIFPLNGHVPFHMGGIRTSSLIAQRLTFKMHREGVSASTHGELGMCTPYATPTLDKRTYKTQLIYPIPNTEKINGKCCQPWGRTTILWGAGKEYPAQGEDFSYMLFRKRNCCVGW